MYHSLFVRRPAVVAQNGETVGEFRSYKQAGGTSRSIRSPMVCDTISGIRYRQVHHIRSDGKIVEPQYGVVGNCLRAQIPRVLHILGLQGIVVNNDNGFYDHLFPDCKLVATVYTRRLWNV